MTAQTMPSASANSAAPTLGNQTQTSAKAKSTQTNCQPKHPLRKVVRRTAPLAFAMLLAAGCSSTESTLAPWGGESIIKEIAKPAELKTPKPRDSDLKIEFTLSPKGGEPLLELSQRLESIAPRSNVQIQEVRPEEVRPEEVSPEEVSPKKNGNNAEIRRTRLVEALHNLNLNGRISQRTNEAGASNGSEYPSYNLSVLSYKTYPYSAKIIPFEYEEVMGKINDEANSGLKESFPKELELELQKVEINLQLWKGKNNDNAGDLIWYGRITQDSRVLENIRVQYRVKVLPKGIKDIQTKISKYNNEKKTAYDNVCKTIENLEKVYSEAKKAIEFDGTKDREKKESERKDKVEQKEKEYHDAVKTFNAVVEPETAIQYSYTVEDAIIEPNFFCKGAKGDISDREVHNNKLISKVTQTLLKNIKIEETKGKEIKENVEKK